MLCHGWGGVFWGLGSGSCGHHTDRRLFIVLWAWCLRSLVLRQGLMVEEEEREALKDKHNLLGVCICQIVTLSATMNYCWLRGGCAQRSKIKVSIIKDRTRHKEH